MDLSEYATDPAKRRELANVVGVNPDYLWQVATGWKGKRASRMLAIAIEHATQGIVTRHSLRPDLFDVPANSAHTVAEAA